MTQDNIIDYSFKSDIRQVFNILLGVGLIGFAVFLFFRFELDTTLLTLILSFILLGIIPLLLTLHYFLNSKKIKVKILTDKNLIEIFLNGHSTNYQIEELGSIEIFEHKGLGLYKFDFDYAKYKFKNDQFFIVNSFMTNGYFIPAGLEPVIKKQFLPIIWKQTNFKNENNAAQQ